MSISIVSRDTLWSVQVDPVRVDVLNHIRVVEPYAVPAVALEVNNLASAVSEGSRTLFTTDNPIAVAEFSFGHAGQCNAAGKGCKL